MRILKAALIDLKSEMINYLNAKNKRLEVGHFIKLFIEAVEIKQIEFANYLSLTSESLTELLTGQSQLNIELAFILEMLTNINAELWIGIRAITSRCQKEVRKIKCSMHVRITVINHPQIAFHLKGETIYQFLFSYCVWIETYKF